MGSETISSSNELWKQNNIISALLFLVSRESEIYTEFNYTLYLMCCFNWTNIYKWKWQISLHLKDRPPLYVVFSSYWKEIRKNEFFRKL